MLAGHRDFGDSHRESSQAGPMLQKSHGKQAVMMEIIKRLGDPFVTLVTDLFAICRKTSAGNLRSSPAIHRSVGLPSPAMARLRRKYEGFSCNCNLSDAATRSARADDLIPAFILWGGTSMR
jgi:hypothetical protein